MKANESFVVVHIKISAFTIHVCTYIPLIVAGRKSVQSSQTSFSFSVGFGEKINKTVRILLLLISLSLYT